MQPRHRWAVILGLAACDVAVLLWATAAALGARYGVSGWPGGDSPSAGGLALILLVPVLAIGLMVMSGGYRLDDLFGGHREYAHVVSASTYAAFAVLALSFLLDVGLSRGALILNWGFACLFLGGERFAFRRLVFGLRRRGRLVRRALIVGADEHAATIARQLSDDEAGWRVLGFLDDYRPVSATVVDDLRVVGDPSAAAEAARAVSASDLIVVPHAVSWEAQRDLLELAASSDGPTIRLAPGFYHLLATGARPTTANFVPLLTLEPLHIAGLDALLKRLLDYGVALAALPVLGALLALLWLLTRLTGAGSLLRRRPALGPRARLFDLLMLAEPEAPEPSAGLRRRAWRLHRSLAGDRLGKLPNVLNVLAGRMSLVGPRALTSSTDLLQHPWARTLLLVRPGLTGPRVDDGLDWAPEEQAIRDVAYVREYSLWLDLRLLFASLMRMLRRERALPASYRAAPEEALPAETAAR